MVENPAKMDELGVPLFQETSILALINVFEVSYSNLGSLHLAVACFSHHHFGC